MATVGELVVNLSANTAALESGMARAERRVAGFGGAAREGFRKAENALTDLGLSVVGLDGKLGKLAEGALLLGVGGTATLALTAGLAAVGVAIRAVSTAGDAQAGKLKEIADRYDGVAEAAKRASRTQMELDRATLEGRLRQLRTTPLTNDMQGWKTLFKGLTLPGGWQQAVQQERAEVLEALAAVDTALADFDRRQRERETAARPKLPGADVFRQQADAMRLLEGSLRSQGNFELDLLRQRKAAAGERAPTPDAFDTLEASLRTLQPAVEATLKKIDQSWVGQQTRMAAFTQEVWLQAARNIESALANTFNDLFTGQLRSLEDFARSVVAIVQRALAEILAAQVAAGLTPILRSAFSPAAPGGVDAGTVAGVGTGIQGGMLRAGGGQPVVVHQHFSYAPQVAAIDAQDAARFFKTNRAALLGEMARMAQDSDTAARALGGRRR